MVTASSQLSLSRARAETLCQQHSRTLPSPEPPSVLPPLTQCHPPALQGLRLPDSSHLCLSPVREAQGDSQAPP